ncbi:MAG: OmpA family protein [Bacteroidia bacterium]|nr:OmpA family protein [Bacteroidia bacterium]
MKNPSSPNRIVVLASLLLTTIALNAQVKYVPLKPMSQVVSTSLKPVSISGAITLPTITWGGDIATVYAEINGLFKLNGLDFTLRNEDNFKAQVQRCINGETPYLRGTKGMIKMASDAFKAAGIELVEIYQISYSNGDDAVVFRPGKNINNARNVALQLYGPHMDYAANLFISAKRRLEDINFKYLEELTLNDNGTNNNPVEAFVADPALDAVFCIIPDALNLTSGGTTGTGSEGSVKGARIGLTTKSANRIIADVYAVRKDYFDTHREEVQKLTLTLMQAEEGLRDLLKNKASKMGEYNKMISRSSELFFGTPTATKDVEPMLEGGCEFVGHAGNITFFTGQGTTRNQKTLDAEIQKAFITMGVLTSPTNVLNANWDYNEFVPNLKYAKAGAITPTPRFDEKKVSQVVENKIKAESTTWESEGTLFVVEIYFQPNQENFTVANYAEDFKEALKLAQTYGGAIVVIEGHSDRGGVLKAKQNGASSQEVAQIEQVAKNLSRDRADNVKKSFLAYCKQSGITFDASQITIVGRGIESPKFLQPRTQEEWKQNFRVVFRVKQLESESIQFDPSIYK